MGMDVYGKSPTDEKGEYFRANAWWWGPLWSYCCEVSLAARRLGDRGQYNDGYGLDATDAAALAAALRKELAAGRTAIKERARVAAIDRMPARVCALCDGTGTRNKPVPNEPCLFTDAYPTPNEVAGIFPRGECNGCGGKGRLPPWEASCGFSAEFVQRFAEFLEHCGGFAIW